MASMARARTFPARLAEDILEAAIHTGAVIAAVLSVIPQLLAVTMMACVWGGILYGLVDLIVGLH